MNHSGPLFILFHSSRVRLHVNVPGSLIIAGNSNKPIRKPPSSTKMAAPSIEIKTTQDDGDEERKMSESGAVSL